MHGHGYAPQQPQPTSGSTHVTLRVVLVVIATITCGLLAWVPMLRLVIVTRKPHDWALFALVTALDVTALVLVGIDPGADEFQEPGNAGMVILLSTLVASVAYYLFADIRHFSRHDRPQRAGFLPPHAQPPYGYPHQAAPGPTHLQPTQMHQPPVQQTPPPPPRPEPARIHQVQAELDELSDYLRKQEGGN